MDIEDKLLFMAYEEMRRENERAGYKTCSVPVHEMTLYLKVPHSLEKMLVKSQKTQLKPVMENDLDVDKGQLGEEEERSGEEESLSKHDLEEMFQGFENGEDSVSFDDSEADMA